MDPQVASGAMAAATPTPEQVVAAFTAGMSKPAMVEAMLPAMPVDAPMALVVQLPSGKVFTFAPQVGLGVLADMLTSALERGSPAGSASIALVATFGGHGPDTPMVAGRFNTIAFDRVVTDPAKAFDPAAGIYVVPHDGLYDVALTFRIADGDMAGLSYGVGVDTANADGPAFEWTAGTGKRQGVQYRRIMACKAGDQLRAFYYVDGPAPAYTAAALTIIRMA